jgi:hypothetical protein
MGTKPSTPQTTGKSGRRRMISSPLITTPEHNIPYHTQYAAMDEIVGQTPLKDLSQIQLVLTRMLDQGTPQVAG